KKAILRMSRGRAVRRRPLPRRRAPRPEERGMLVRSSRQPSLERLEDRCVPATFGTPWPDPSHLTLSFAPDGTVVGDQASTLFSPLNAIAPTAAWQREVLRAFQTWAVQANINIGLVADGGQAFGAAGLPQGDAHFGDVRVAGTAQPPGELASASPF